MLELNRSHKLIGSFGEVTFLEIKIPFKIVIKLFLSYFCFLWSSYISFN